jgi:hypothetical protein
MSQQQPTHISPPPLFWFNFPFLIINIIGRCNRFLQKQKFNLNFNAEIINRFIF